MALILVKIAADDHRLEFGVVDVAGMMARPRAISGERTQGDEGGDFGACFHRQQGPLRRVRAAAAKVLALGDVDHLFVMMPARANSSCVILWSPVRAACGAR